MVDKKWGCLQDVKNGGKDCEGVYVKVNMYAPKVVVNDTFSWCTETMSL